MSHIKCSFCIHVANSKDKARKLFVILSNLYFLCHTIALSNRSCLRMFKSSLYLAHVRPLARRFLLPSLLWWLWSALELSVGGLLSFPPTPPVPTSAGYSFPSALSALSDRVRVLGTLPFVGFFHDQQRDFAGHSP